MFEPPCLLSITSIDTSDQPSVTRGCEICVYDDLGCDLQDQRLEVDEAGNWVTAISDCQTPEPQAIPDGCIIEKDHKAGPPPETPPMKLIASAGEAEPTRPDIYSFPNKQQIDRYMSGLRSATGHETGIERWTGSPIDLTSPSPSSSSRRRSRSSPTHSQALDRAVLRSAEALKSDFEASYDGRRKTLAILEAIENEWKRNEA
ncbi:hypothetical protein IAU59_007555 [Kwoniella sp. CBS 9459]